MNGVEPTIPEIVLLDDAFDALLTKGESRLALPCYVTTKYWEKNTIRRYYSVTGTCVASRKDWETVGVAEGHSFYGVGIWRDNYRYFWYQFCKQELKARGVGQLALSFSMDVTQQKSLHYNDTTEVFDKIGLTQRLVLAEQKHQAYLDEQAAKIRENRGKKRYRDGQEPVIKSKRPK